MSKFDKLRVEWRKFPDHYVFRQASLMERFLKKREALEEIRETIPETSFCYLCGKKEDNLLRVVHDSVLLSACTRCALVYEDVKNSQAEDMVLVELGLLELEPFGPDIEFNTSFYDDYE